MKKRKSCVINGLKYPSSDQISGRSSTICRSMACTLLLRDGCSPEEEKKWMQFFPEKRCAYCGKSASHLDHLHALIENRKPTGYGTEPANLVPCCKDCNQPKGNLEWEEYMRSTNCKHIGNSKTDDPHQAMEMRIAIIKAFQEAMPPQKAIIDEETLHRWNEILICFDEALKKAQDELMILKEKIYQPK